VLVDGRIEQARHPELVHVQHGGVAVVEDHGVAQLVVRLPDERLRALEAREEDLGQRPGVVKVVEH
jgi:hypothetical protein